MDTHRLIVYRFPVLGFSVFQILGGWARIGFEDRVILRIESAKPDHGVPQLGRGRYAARKKSDRRRNGESSLPWFPMVEGR